MLQTIFTLRAENTMHYKLFFDTNYICSHFTWWKGYETNPILNYKFSDMHLPPEHVRREASCSDPAVWYDSSPHLWNLHWHFWSAAGYGEISPQGSFAAWSLVINNISVQDRYLEYIMFIVYYIYYIHSMIHYIHSIYKHILWTHTFTKSGYRLILKHSFSLSLSFLHFLPFSFFFFLLFFFFSFPSLVHTSLSYPHVSGQVKLQAVSLLPNISVAGCKKVFCRLFV